MEMDSLARTGTRAAHQAEARTPVQPPLKEMEKRPPLTEAHTGRRSRRAALRREQLEDNPQGRKSGRRGDWKKCLHQHDVEVPLARLITDATGMFPQKIRNGNTPVSYSGRAALRREPKPELQNQRRRPLAL
jgi:hypothetical protein